MLLRLLGVRVCPSVSRLLLTESSASLPMSAERYESGAGSGSGRGGGTGGSVRDAGGKFGEMEYAREEEYFRRMQQEQLKNLSKELEREVEHHEKQMTAHKEAIERHKKRIDDLSHEQERLVDK